VAHEDVLVGFKDAYNDTPRDIFDGDKVYWTIVAVAGHANDWAAYMGFADPYSVARSGEKLDQELAEKLFPIMARTGRTYRL
jgi:hypothetical protein